MPGERRRMTRAESQQRTREEVLDAAEELFLEFGFHGTTVAKIAAAAGRTQGAIYANFSSKENLCADVLLRCYMRTFAELIAKMAESSGPLEAQMGSLAVWFKRLVSEESLVALAAEYALAIHKNPEQLAVSGGHIDMGRNMLGAMLASMLPFGVDQASRDVAVNAILATGTGLALGRTLGVIDDDQLVDLLIHTVRLWAADLGRGTAVQG
ncbi:TetR/AcrR family transcriptional regulator [Nocardia yunnanensis]|uniref:TetR/AcrR family transcriptional regulator n=1 Tax=Nocardia yunnanensis TaxID=2382165 RepID=A0A386ZGV2_9NOCA|nr:TetR/AcrR family transcriptional regulator [Nocardia yunnanensis]AYF76788.1 TetR/AcrR family transcriptional regulator [Nocardia yunnanensis]